MVGYLVRQDAGRTGDRDIRLNDAGHQTMVEPGSRGLNPAEAALLDDLIPRDRNLSVATENIGGQQQFGDSLLTSIDYVELGGGSSDLIDMPRVDRITENYATSVAGGWR